MSHKLAGRVAIVTGGGKGIGRGVALRLAAEGAEVAIVERDAEAGTRTAKELGELGPSALYVRADVSRKDDVLAAVQATRDAFGPVTILVNNAIALSPNVLLEDKTDEMLDQTMHVGVWATWWAMRAVLPDMRAAGGGSIVNFRSIDGEAGAWLHSDYNMTKEASAGSSRTVRRLVVQWSHVQDRTHRATRVGCR